jgi:hypothetical protein
MVQRIGGSINAVAPVAAADPQHQERTRTMHTQYSVRPRTVRAVALVVIATVVVGSAMAACRITTPQPRPAASVADEVRSTTETLLNALVAADVPTLQRLHATDFQAVTPDGSVLSRDGFLHAGASGDLDFRRFDAIAAKQIRVHGDAAAVRYEATIDIVVAGMGRLRHNIWQTDLYEHRDGRWQVVWSQATAVGPIPTPEPAP